MPEPLDIVLAPEDTDHELAIAQRAAILTALAEVGADDPRLPIAASEAEVFSMARSMMRYEHDPNGWDTARTIKGMIDYIEREKKPAPGDCMHRAALIAALLTRAGMGAQLLFQSFNGQRFQHVLALSGAGTAFDPQECTRLGERLAAQRELAYVVSERRI